MNRIHRTPVSRRSAILIFGLTAGLWVSMALAHTPLFACYDHGDGTILCEGGFSDGSSAAGVAIRILDGDGKPILEDALDANSEIELQRPEGAFTVIFDAGPGHLLEITGSDIH